MNPNLNPELVVASAPIDLELCALLGDQPSDFLVLCLDGVQLEGFGTPYDTPRNRVERQGLVDRLNDRSEQSLWPELFNNWRPAIAKQFKLAEEITAKDFRPVVSLQISRVCPGYSQYLHCAIGLFETVSAKMEGWHVSQLENGESSVEIAVKGGALIVHSGQKMPLVITEAVVRLLKGTAT